ncbi:MAG: hypothetical protein Q4B71_05950 [Cardiobacteriaceae bacterium]|nr:hypothetical protein [Cardiobacteriaceae bacterium]
MKKLVLSVILASQLFTQASFAQSYPQLDVKAAVGETSVNFEVLEQSIQTLQQFAGTYPPVFDTIEDKERAQQDSAHIAHVFNVLLESKTIDAKNPEHQNQFLMMARNAWVAHNLDLKGARENAKKYYLIAIALSPNQENKALLQQEYGEFLTSAGWAKEGEQVLRQAVKLRPEAGYALGLNLLGQKKINPSAAVMKRYVQKFPNDEKGKQVYQALRAGTVHFK